MDRCQLTYNLTGELSGSPKPKRKKIVAKEKKKKRVPAMVFNNGAYTYPKGLRIEDEAEYDEKLDSGKWLTGPGVPAGEPAKPKKKALSHMNTEELVAEALEMGLEIDEDWKKADLLEAIRNDKD